MEKSHFIDMGVNELLHELLTNENIQLGQIDIFNHIKRNTNNFDAESIFLMYNDLYGFLDNNVCMTFEGECYRLADFYEIKHSNLNDIPNLGLNNGVKLKEIIDSVDWVYNDARELELMRNFDLVYELYNKPGLELEYEIENIVEYVDDFEYELLKRKNDIKKFMGSGEWKLHNTSQNKFKSKQPLTFPGLFKDEFKGKIQLFYNRLIANGLIDKNHVWRETTIKNEPAKVYYWLLDKGVFKMNKPTPALICFCKEFGITVYRDTEPTPPADVRAVTVKNLLIAETTITPDERKRFEQMFSPFLIK